MQPYQNYLTTQNPMYQSNYQPIMNNPYMQRMENLQQFQQALNPAPQNQYMSIGKVVESMDIVKVTDIPMDGNTYYFPKADGTEIYSKQFMPNGQTRILTFKPSLEENPNNLPQEDKQEQFEAFNDVLRGIQSDIKALTDKVDKISKPTKAKKEVLEDE